MAAFTATRMSAVITSFWALYLLEVTTTSTVKAQWWFWCDCHHATGIQFWWVWVASDIALYSHTLCQMTNTHSASTIFFQPFLVHTDKIDVSLMIYEHSEYLTKHINDLRKYEHQLQSVFILLMHPDKRRAYKMFTGKIFCRDLRDQDRNGKEFFIYLYFI